MRSGIVVIWGESEEFNLNQFREQCNQQGKKKVEKQ